MSSKCARCGKTVFFAEKQSYDGKDFHGICLISYKKELKPSLIGVYPGDEHRVAGQLKKTKAPRDGTVNFCPNCGNRVSGATFCSSCGNKL